MNWEAIGAIGDFVSGLAVLVALLYLAAQLRQSQREVRRRRRSVSSRRRVRSRSRSPRASACSRSTRSTALRSGPSCRRSCAS